MALHRITRSHLNSFSVSHGFSSLSEEKQFEYFVNYSLLSPLVAMNFDLDDVTTGDKDDGVDGIAIVIDEELVCSVDHAIQIFESGKRSLDVEIFFVQAKTSNSLDLGDFLKFKESVLRFIDGRSDYIDEVQKNVKEIFEIVLANVPYIRGGQPNLTAWFVSAGVYDEPDIFEKTKQKFIEDVDVTGFFKKINVAFLGRNEIHSFWVSTFEKIRSEIQMFSSAALPNIYGVDEAYLAVVKAKELVANLLSNKEGGIRSHVFQENVRAFLGIDNPVNKSIADTLKEDNKSTRFPVLNNGITIVSSDVRVQGNTLYLEDFQIVNGCQTSNVLFECRDSLDESIMVSLKVIETSNADVFSDLVRATNSQSKVEDKQFYSLLPIIKRVESYFNTFEGEEGRIYLERRDKQYAGTGIPVLRTFSVNDAAKAVAAMFLERPDLAYRYPKQMYDQLGSVIFNDKTKESVFYAGCLALYRLYSLVAAASIPQNVRKYKWHIIALVRAIISGKTVPDIKSKKIDSYVNNIINVCNQGGRASLDPFQKAVAIIQSFDDLSPDSLKKQSMLAEMISRI